MGVVAAGMCSGTFGGAGGEYAAVATDVEVIACAVETALAVGGFQCLLRKGRSSHVALQWMMIRVIVRMGMRR